MIGNVRTKKYFLITSILAVGAIFSVYQTTKVLACTIDAITTCSQAELQQLLSQQNDEIANTQRQLDAQRTKSTSIKSNITLLDNLIKKQVDQIKIKNKIIAQLGTQIDTKQQKIQTLGDKIEKEHESLGQLIRKTNEIDENTMVHLLLSEGTLSEFYTDVDTFGTLKQAIKQSVNTIRGVKTETEQEKQSLEESQNKQLDAKAEIEAEKKKVEADKKDKNTLLSLSKSAEKQFEKDLAAKQAQAGKIRAALFQFAGGTAAIPFDQALAIAQSVSSQAGIRPAFLLAIIKQETNLGANQGQCYVRNFSDGSGVNKKTGAYVAKVMSTKGLPLFQSLTGSLGLDPSNTQVSCPLSYGYGGAMGPAQFIPTTWVLYANRVASALGVSVANPWNPRDAFMASALLLADNGATGQTYSSERNAACRYYSGNKCGVGSAPNTFYGNGVMAKAESIQADIDYISKYGTNK